jgi:hypothetical protein
MVLSDPATIIASANSIHYRIKTISKIHVWLSKPVKCMDENPSKKSVCVYVCVCGGGGGGGSESRRREHSRGLGACPHA